MKTPLLRYGALWALAICAAFSSHGAEEKYVEVTTEIQFADWGYWFFSDNVVPRPDNEGPRKANLFPRASARRVVIGAGTWMVEGDLPYKETRWFTGTNIVDQTQISQTEPAGHGLTRLYESDDGNPGRPVRVPDVMGSDLPAKVCWLAFCSAPSLRHERRTIFPPSDLWKESRLASSGWSEHTEVFKDGLGLPKRLALVDTNGQTVFQYQVHSSTNLLGWNIPMEFYGVQYNSTGSNQWNLHLTFKGRVTSISVGTKPEIPAEVFKPVQK